MNERLVHKYVQMDPVVTRRTKQVVKRIRSGKGRRQYQQPKNEENELGDEEIQHSINQNKIELISVENVIENKNEENKIMEEKYNALKKQIEDHEEKLKISEELSKKKEEKLKEFENQNQCLQDKIDDLLHQNEQLKKNIAEEKDPKIVEQKRIIDDLTTMNESNTKKIQTLIKERDDLKNLLTQQRSENEKFTSPISSQVKYFFFYFFHSFQVIPLVFQIISKQQKNNLVDFTDYAYLISAQPNSLKSKIKIVEKQTKLIENYKKNTDELFQRCLYILSNY